MIGMKKKWLTLVTLKIAERIHYAKGDIGISSLVKKMKKKI